MHLPDNRLGRPCSGRERVMFVDENHQVDDSCERLRGLRDHLHAHVQTRRIRGIASGVVDVDTLTDRARPQSSDRAMVSYALIWDCGPTGSGGEPGSCFLISSVDEPDRLGPGLDPGFS